MKIKLLYGDEFWSEIDHLIKYAKDRVFLASAYWGAKYHKDIMSKINPDIFYYFAARGDSTYKPSDRCLIIDKNSFHGKIYLIDNCIIIGSQNLYKAQIERQGEYSVLFDADDFTSSLILYQALLKIAEQSSTCYEPINQNFIKFYDEGCPFCGNANLPEPFSIHRCPEYGGGFISDEDCLSYGGDGACKYCIEENRENIGECYCCDHSGCGFGVSLSCLKFIYHTFDSPNRNKEERAKEFVKLFNFLSKYMNEEDTIEFFEALGFKGKIYDVRLERMEWNFT